jgi:dienelactone hydrolase
MSSSTKPKPAIVLVPGCWHVPAHYQELIEILQNAGYPTELVNLPSLNPTDGFAHTITADIDAVREKLLSQVDQGKDVILLNHSYGGCPGGAAAKGLSPAERPGSGAVIGLVYFAGYLVQENHSVVQTAAEQYPWLTDEVSDLPFQDMYINLRLRLTCLLL